MTLAGLERRISQSTADCFASGVVAEGKSMSSLGLTLKTGRLATSSMWFYRSLSGKSVGARNSGWWSLSQTSLLLEVSPQKRQKGWNEAFNDRRSWQGEDSQAGPKKKANPRNWNTLWLKESIRGQQVFSKFDRQQKKLRNVESQWLALGNSNSRSVGGNKSLQTSFSNRGVKKGISGPRGKNSRRD